MGSERHQEGGGGRYLSLVSAAFFSSPLVCFHTRLPAYRQRAPVLGVSAIAVIT